MSFSLFQLGAQAWLNPQMVAQAMGVTPVGPLLQWAQEAIRPMQHAGFEGKQIRQFKIATGNLAETLEKAMGGDDVTKLLDPVATLTRLIAGIKDDEKWREFVQRIHKVPLDPSTERSKAWSLVLRLRFHIQLPEPFYEKMHRTIFDASAEAVKAFVQFCENWTEEYAVFPLSGEEMEVLTYLLEEGEEAEYIIRLLMQMDDPLRESRLYRKYLERYKEVPTLRPVPYSKLSKGEKIALYIYVSETAHPKSYPFFSYSFETFNDWLKVECALAQRIKVPAPLAVFAQRVRNYDPSSEARIPEGSYGILSHLLRKFDFVPHEIVARVVKIIFEKSRELRASFRKNTNIASTQGDLEAAIELLEANIILNDGLFRKYARDPNRRQKMEEAREVRARELAGGAKLGNLTDPFEMMAVMNVIGDPSLSPREIAEILRKAKRHAIHLGHQAFEKETRFMATPQKYLLHEVVDKHLLEQIIWEIKEYDSAKWLVASLLRGYKKGSVPKKEAIEFFGKDRFENLLKDPWTLEEEEAIKFLKFIPRAMSASGKWNMRTLKRVLIALTWHEELNEEAKRAIRTFDIELPPEEILRIVEEADNFFTVEFGKTLDRYREHIDKDAKAFVGWEIKQLAKILSKFKEVDTEPIEVTLKSSRNLLDVFYSYVARNCLARPEYAIYALAQPGFVPIRILVDGEWRGTIMTYTKIIGSRDYLIVTGIDPQIYFKPSEFLDQLEEYFEAITREGKYDLVLIPDHPGTQSSRRAFLSRNIKARYAEQYEIEEGVGFPRRGPGFGDEAYYGIHKNFVIMIDNRPPLKIIRRK